MVLLFTQTAREPPREPLIPRLDPQIVLLRFRDQNLCLLRQARHVCEARRSTARTHAHEAFLRFPVQSLRADVARLALRVFSAHLRRDREGLRVLLICVVLLGAACFFYLFAELVMASNLPVLFLARGAAVARAAASAFLARG